MAIVFPTIFANQSGNLAASTLDNNFTYTGTLPSQATTISAASYALTGLETVLINAGATPYGATLQQVAAATGIGSAAQLQNARTISTTGDVTYTSEAFNGTKNVTGTATVVSASTSTAGKVQLATSAQTLAGSSSSIAMTPASFAGNSSIVGNGWYRLPGGLLVQWGQYPTGGATSVSVPFNTAYVTAYFAVATVQPTGTAAISVSAGTPTTTAFQAYISSAAQNAVNWISIGV